ncbi:LysR substrate-binding domain-containing protein [Cohaesibacter celericrescens]|uniref:LysR family transcriptional regulator n=1 Tax=Cohaesibacter celericrescens TaxID=2067669 RepID=A0A2N5XRQ9_9HYPH|nr:LysR substrate-binding domain-containing protein [Cohaesibacter celericrescens]PLW77140.1 LysR family transcriptional regulator [Cohaesibacter celericrescens]
MLISRRSLPPLNALRAFEVSGRQLNFRAAAEELGVTQGAVAQQVRMLEAHLGISLFQRVPRGVVLTPQGAAYLSEVTRAFDTLSKATAQLHNRTDALTISVTPTFATKLLIPQLSMLKSMLPEVELRTVATVKVSDFDRDQVDIAVRQTHPPFSAAIETHLLFRQDLVLVASPHLLKGLPLPLTREQIKELPLLHDADNHWPKFFGTVGRLPGAIFNQTSLALDAALAGQGVAIACRAFVKADLVAKRLVNVSDANFGIESDFYLVRKRSPYPRDTVDAVWAWCIASFAE